MAGLATGLIQGFSVADQALNRRDARKQRQQQLDQNEAYRQQGLENQDRLFDWRKDRAERQDTLAAQQHEDLVDYRDKQYGLSKQKTAATVRASSIAAQNAEWEQSQKERAAREKENRRYLTAGYNEIVQNGVTSQAVDLLQKGGMHLDQYLDPEFNESLQTLHDGLSGAPIDTKTMVTAASRVFRPELNRKVGEKTPDGKTITRVELNRVIPAKDGEHAYLDLNVYTTGKDGKESQYTAPMTVNRSSHDDMVLPVSLDKVAGKIKGMEFFNRAINKDQLASAIKEHEVLNGAMDASDKSDWGKLNDTTLFDRKSGSIKKIKVEPNKSKRYAKALEYAQKDMAAAQKDLSSDIGKMNDEQVQNWIIKRRDMYLKAMTPGGKAKPQGGGLPPVRDDGWRLMKDANGNRAYVSPDGSKYEEIK